MVPDPGCVAKQCMAFCGLFMDARVGGDVVVGSSLPVIDE